MVQELTSSAGGIILNDRNEVLLVNEGDGFWGFPKGRIEQGETALVTALREIKEETGLTDLIKLADLGTYQRHPVINSVEDKTELKSITLFLFRTSQELPIENIENNQCAWFVAKQVADKLSHMKDREFFDQALHHIAQS